jgi:glycosyltransferase involved in cell wall biosynthesis
MELSIIIPTHNEAGCLVQSLPVVQAMAARLTDQYELVVVDAGSTDGTAEMAAQYGARVVHQPEPGYGAALKAGFAAARGRFIVTMDADFSHRPEFLRRMWAVSDRAEVIIASRYLAGSHARMPRLRQLFSYLLNGCFSRALSLPFRDLSSGFRMYKRTALEQIQIESTGDEALEEILIKLYAKGFTITEVPFAYLSGRTRQDRARIRFALRLLRTLYRMWKLRNSVDCCDYDWRAYDSWLPPQRYWQRQRFRILTGFSAGATHTLDVGCGSSRILLNLPNAIGLDIYRNKVRFLRPFGQPLVQGTLFALPFKDGQFDCVVCSEVVEHVPADPKWCEELIRMLAPDGRLIIGTPDYGRWIWHVIEWIYGKVMPGAYADEHISHYTYASLTGLLARYGFRPVASRYILWGDMYVSFRKS